MGILSLRATSAIKVKILQTQGLLLAQQHRAFDHVAKLSDISRPCVRLESLQALWPEFQATAAKIRRKFFQQVFGEHRNVFLARAQGRKGQGNRTDAKVKIVPEFLFTYQMANVLMRGRQ